MEKMEGFSGNGLNFIPFESREFPKQFPIHLSGSEAVDNFLTSISYECTSTSTSTSKAIFTILLPSTKILVVNSSACQLINYTSDELCSMKLENLVNESLRNKWSSLLSNFLKDPNQTPLNKGKLLELVGKDEETILVFLFLKKIDNPQRCLAIAEPLDKNVALISIDANGKILSYDKQTALIFQYDALELVGVNINTLLPAITFLKTNEEQQKKILEQNITGRTKSKEAFPAHVTITQGNSILEVYQITIQVYTSLKGLILLNKELAITKFDEYFVKLLFGFSKREILYQPVTDLIPTFCNEIRLGSSKKGQCHNGISILINEKYLNCSEKVDAYPDLNLLDSFVKHESLTNEIPFDDSYSDISSDGAKYSTLTPLFKFSKKENFQELENITLPMCSSSAEGNNLNLDLKCKTKKHEKEKEKDMDSFNYNLPVQEGKFLGFGRHSDGTYIDINYSVKIIGLSDETYYYILLTRNLHRFGDIGHGQSTNLSTVSSFNSTSFDISVSKDSYSEQCTRPSTASMISQCDESLIAGEYSEFYSNIRQIGKGAYGYVKMAFRNSDGLLVVTKFIKKQKINIRSWVFDAKLNMKIPLEISLLTTIEHPNIVKVLDVFHNDSFFQLVMEKHGAGFDLFEFIDRGPKCDEQLKSYIFRQIVSAVHYLDSLGILHRDIKDENVIINEKFEIKLIDFGSATFMSPDETFSKFYGTVEYCSPEVLQGNSYKGPELEIWALGVTLYVLTFGENPFYDIEETIKGQFSIPLAISVDLNHLLHKMLDKDINTRINIAKLMEDPWVNQPVFVEKYRFEEVVRCYEEEAYPPKYISEIHSEEINLKKNSRVESNQVAIVENSDSDIQNTPNYQLGDFEGNFQNLDKSTHRKTFSDRNISPVMRFSTPVQKINERMCKSAASLRRRLENCVTLKDCDLENSDVDAFSKDLNSDLNRSGDFDIGSPNLIVTENLKKEICVPVSHDNEKNDLEIKMRFEKSALPKVSQRSRTESSRKVGFAESQ